MKSLFLLATVIFCLPCMLFSQIADISWEKSLQVSGINYYSDVVEDSDEGFAVIGGIKEKGRSFDFWLLKFNSKGDTVWTKTFGTEHNDVPKRIVQLSDGAFLVLGCTETDSTEHSILVKINGEGKELWRKSLGDSTFVFAEDLVSLEEGKFAVAGHKGEKSDNPRLWMAKMDAQGEMIWEKVYKEEFKGCARSLKKLPDGGFAIAGQVSENGDNDCDILAFRTNEKGKANWYSWFKSPKQKVWPECICCSADSCFIVVGWRGKCMNDINSENPVFDFDLAINKINCKGEIVWSKSFDREGSEGGNAIAIRPDGNFIVAGIKATSFLGKIGPWLLQVDSDGNQIDEKLLKFRFQNDHASRIINCTDGGFVVIGPGEQKETHRHSNGWIVKFEDL